MITTNKVYFQATVFSSLIDVTPTAFYLSAFVKEFSGEGFIPSTFQEISNSDMLTRLSLRTIDNEWQIEFGINRLDLIKTGKDGSGSNLVSEKSFCNEVIGLIERINTIYPIKSNRLALSSSVLLDISQEERLNKVYFKFNNPTPFYRSNIPHEWNSRQSTRLNKSINDKEELLNIITQINRVNARKKEGETITFFDAIELKLDLNTFQNNVEYRFNYSSIKEFYSNVSDWHLELQNDIINYIDDGE